ncbi:MAG: SRPBCC family protein [Bdellovibrionales bacterium]|nr:SRPBCC family protein [Bdellovibrionales bacterium]
MVIKILIGFVVLVAIIAIYAYTTAPDSLSISRSILIQVPAEKIFPYVNNPRRMQEWNPFTEGDPTLKMTYTGPDEGVGAASAWEGNSNTGMGQATIVEVEPNKRVSVRLDFKKPFDVTNFGEYRLEPKGSATEFTWSIVETAMIPRLISRFINLDKVIGGHFERGLAKLKSLAESKNRSQLSL